MVVDLVKVNLSFYQDFYFTIKDFWINSVDPGLARVIRQIVSYSLYKIVDCRANWIFEMVLVNNNNRHPNSLTLPEATTY